MPGAPDIILLGYGAADSLQLTVEAEQVLVRYGRALCVGLPPNLARYLKSRRVDAVDLGAKLASGRAFSEAYLDVAAAILERTDHERPVIALMPGSPLVTNAIGRYLAQEGPRRGLEVRSLAAVSQLDVLISALGLDVSTFGLQVFDATKLVERRLPLNPGVPTVLLQAAAFGLNAIPPDGARSDAAPLASYLAERYPPGHAVTLLELDVASGSIAAATITLGELPEALAGAGPRASLFVDAVRPSARASEHAGAAASQA